MKTAEEILSEHSKNYGMIKDNPRAIVKASEALDAMKEYAKQLLEEYTNRIVENAKTKQVEYSSPFEFIKEELKLKLETIIDKESITNQLKLYLSELNLAM